MRSRLLAAFAALILVLSPVGVRAQEPKAAVPPAPRPDESAVNQEILARQFRDFEQSLLRLAQRLERSNKPEDRERAAGLKKAIAFVSDRGTDAKFDRLVAILRQSRTLSLQEIQEAMTQNRMLAEDIKAVLALLLSDNRDDELKREQERLKEQIKRLGELIRQQKIVRSRTESGKDDKDSLKDAQGKVTKDTGELARDMGKKGDDKKNPPKDGKPSDGRGQPKDGKGEPKDGKQQGDKSEGQPAPDTPGKKQVEDANNLQKQAEERIKADDRSDASKKQDKAVDKLEQARKQLEEILRQMREEEQERVLARLQQRVERMLQMQTEVYEGTVRVDRSVGENPDKKPTRANEQRALQLSDREEEIIKEANAAIQILQEEGSAVAFPEVFIQVRDDMRNVGRRLGKADVGHVTQVIEQDVITTLKEMIEALKKAQQKLQARRSQQQQGQQGQRQQGLIELVAELKMVKAMQLRVNARTKVYGERYPGEQAADPDVRKELANLAERQWKIFDVTSNIANNLAKENSP